MADLTCARLKQTDVRCQIRSPVRIVNYRRTTREEINRTALHEHAAAVEPGAWRTTEFDALVIRSIVGASGRASRKWVTGTLRRDDTQAILLRLICAACDPQEGINMRLSYNDIY